MNRNRTGTLGRGNMNTQTIPAPSDPTGLKIRAIILTRWVLAILNGDVQSQRMYESMPLGEPEF